MDLMLTPRQIERASDRILKQAEIYCIPVPVVSLARSYGFAVYVDDELPKETMYLLSCGVKPEDCKILVSESLSKAEQRFAIANALMHFIFHRDGNLPWWCSGDNTNWVRCKWHEGIDLTVSLLMPKRKIKQFVKRHEGCDADAIADYFGVPVAWVYRRVHQLRLSRHVL